jgi:hypothetical protein
MDQKTKTKKGGLKRNDRIDLEKDRYIISGHIDMVENTIESVKDYKEEHTIDHPENPMITSPTPDLKIISSDFCPEKEKDPSIEQIKEIVKKIKVIEESPTKTKKKKGLGGENEKKETSLVNKYDKQK